MELLSTLASSASTGIVDMASAVGSTVSSGANAVAALKPEGFNFEGLLKDGQLQSLGGVFQEGEGLGSLGQMQVKAPEFNFNDQLKKRNQPLPDFMSQYMPPR